MTPMYTRAAPTARRTDPRAPYPLTWKPFRFGLCLALAGAGGAP
jgi:hypothetical protein